MAANLLSVKFRDYLGKEGTFSCYVDSNLAPGGAEIQELVENWAAMSDCEVVGARLQQVIDISGYTLAAASGSDSEALVQSQASLQWDKTTGPGQVRISVPGPKDAIFDQAGAFQNVDVDEAQALVAAFITTALSRPTTPNILRSGDEDTLTYDKGYRKGFKHS